VGAGAKGAHADVTKLDASRFVTGTYLLLGDILRLHGRGEDEVAASTPVGQTADSPEPEPITSEILSDATTRGAGPANAGT
jgi:hypothetical protein